VALDFVVEEYTFIIAVPYLFDYIHKSIPQKLNADWRENQCYATFSVVDWEGKYGYSGTFPGKSCGDCLQSK
jgi:hypothetical protein